MKPEKLPDLEARISSFWTLFRDCADELRKTESSETAVYDSLLKRIQEIEEGLFIEFCVEPEGELIITADGKRELFPIVDRIVSQAPQVSRWKIFALKPKLGLPKSVRWEGSAFETQEIAFDPLESENPDSLGVRFLVPLMREQDIEHAHSAILLAVDHLLGERKFSLSIDYTEVRTLPTGSSVNDFIPLHQLEDYVDWHRERQGLDPLQ